MNPRALVVLHSLNEPDDHASSAFVRHQTFNLADFVKPKCPQIGVELPSRLPP